jgi:hypothetical protein
MATWKKTLIAGFAATIIGAGATGAALASSGRNSGNDRRIDTTQPAVLDSHGTGISDDGIGHENETPEAGEDQGHDSNSNSTSNSGPSENQGPGEDVGGNDDGNHDDGEHEDVDHEDGSHDDGDHQDDKQGSSDG